MESLDSDDRIAIIGMAGRFPGARNVEALWALLTGGLEARTLLSDRELRAAGLPEDLLSNPSYVKSWMRFEGAELFDAEFFGYSPRQAATLDPQQRHFLECCWEGLEAAGYGSLPEGMSAGVFGGSGFGSHLCEQMLRAVQTGAGNDFHFVFDSDKDYLASRVSYKLGLTGPSMAVQTACSTSLVAVHLACRSLLDFECDIALAGGASLVLPSGRGHLYVNGGILSPDGHCRAFDAAANGSTPGSGAAVVVLRRLADALAAGDPIDAVIRSTAVNNDGSRKVGYTAPGLNSQVQLLTTALALAELSPRDIGMLEAHGTGTPLGDAIELEALNQVYGAAGKERFCALGSIKTNIGHLDAAAGVTGLIKAVLCLKHRSLVPTLHFSQPNSLLAAPGSPFYVNTRTRPWAVPAGRVRRAAVSSFGLGGTNAHAILEEPPRDVEEARAPEAAAARDHIFPLSARNPAALERIAGNLADRLEADPGLELADVAYTLQMGRRRFECRRALAACEASELITQLRAGVASHRDTVTTERTGRPVTWMFPGLGVQQGGMAVELYRTDAEFRKDVDVCAGHFSRHLNFDIRQLISEPAAPGGISPAMAGFVQPAVFTVEHCLANLLTRSGVRPHAVVGHSFGEYAAACAAGVLSLEDAIQLVVRRAQLVARLPAGSMFVVCVPEERVRELRQADIHIAAINAADQCVVAGETAAMRAFSTLLETHGIEHYRMWSSRAFHSPLMSAAAPGLRASASHLSRQPPRIPYVSCVSGEFATARQLTDPGYWAEHLMAPVQFAAALGQLARTRGSIFIEVGPGRTLTDLARRALAGSRDFEFAWCLGPMGPTVRRSDLLNSIGKLWADGATLDWQCFHTNRHPRRLSLPTYPFERRIHLLPRVSAAAAPAAVGRATTGSRLPPTEWFYLPSWRRSMTPSRAAAPDLGDCLVLEDASGLGKQLIVQLRASGCRVAALASSTGNGNAPIEEDSFAIDPRKPAEYSQVIQQLRARSFVPKHVIHCWSLTSGEQGTAQNTTAATFDAGCVSILYLMQALRQSSSMTDVSLLIVTNESQSVLGDEPINGAKGAMSGLSVVLSQESARFRFALVDLPGIAPPEIEPLSAQYARYVPQLLAETQSIGMDPVVAYRGNSRLVQCYEQAGTAWLRTPVRMFRDGGVYAITGGLGEIGLAIAERLALQHKARLLLLARQPSAAAAARISMMESAGAQVLVSYVDVCDESALRAACDAAEARFGPINGVFHLAADLKHRSMNRRALELEPRDIDAQMRPKVLGLLLLMRMFAERNLDFGVVFSSNAAFLGGMGFGAYAAACAVQDGVTLAASSRGRSPWITINWDVWLKSRPLQAGGSVSEPNPYVTSFDEGLETLWRIVEFCTAPQIVISPLPLQPRIDRWVIQSRREHAADEPGASESSADSGTRRTPKIEREAPRTDLERDIAGIWEEMLGATGLGVNENFLELGGDSLIGLRIVARLQDVFGVNVSPAALIGPEATIAGLARRIVTDLADLVGANAGSERLPELATAP
jgi:phthiocerol/phenolphthiocerol synthesis type-I polyketide synthase E